MKPVTALVATFAAIGAAFSFDTSGRAVFCLAAVTAHLAVTRRLKDGLQFIWWGLLFALPLLLIHAILNPAFAVSGDLAWGVPFRAEGLAFALRQSTLILTLFIPALYWFAVPRASLVALLCRLPLSPSSAAPVFDIVVVLAEMDRRARTIFEAQRARGIQMTGAPWRKVAAALALVVPLVTTLLRDAPVRARIRCYLKTSEAAFASGGQVTIFSMTELLACAAVGSAVGAVVVAVTT